jgi:hypothetical protein
MRWFGIARYAFAPATLFLLFVCLQVDGQTPQPTVSPAEREAHWRQDIQFLVDGLRATGHTVDLRQGITTRGQIDFLKLYPPGPFDAAVESLESDIPKLSDAEIILQIMRLMASAHVAHNTVQFPIASGFFERLPFVFRWYSDGLAVVRSAPEYSSALGTRVLSIGGTPPEQLLQDLAPYIAHESDQWLRSQATEFLRSGAVLRHLGRAGAEGRVALTLQKPGGEPFDISMALGDPRGIKLTMEEALHITPPLYRSRPGSYYWYQYLADSQTLYIQYNRCENDPKQSFRDFSRQALAEADAHATRRVAIDLRLNGGGDSRIINPLKDGLASRLKKIGRVYVLTGTGTFSSAVMNAHELQSSLGASLVGQPTGGRPSSYGNVKLLTLPNSKLVIQYTGAFVGSAKDAAAELMPDLAVPLTIADALAGRDPVLEAMIAAAR